MEVLQCSFKASPLKPKPSVRVAHIHWGLLSAIKSGVRSGYLVLGGSRRNDVRQMAWWMDEWLLTSFRQASLQSRQIFGRWRIEYQPHQAPELLCHFPLWCLIDSGFFCQNLLAFVMKRFPKHDRRLSEHKIDSVRTVNPVPSYLLLSPGARLKAGEEGPEDVTTPWI